MSKSLLYAVNSTAQTVTPTGVVNFGSVSRRYGSNINLNSEGNVEASGSGYYAFDLNLTGTVNGTGLMTVTLLKNGKAVPGATQSLNFLATGDIAALSFACVDRITSCPCLDTEYTVQISGEITSFAITNATIVVEKS